MVLTRMRAGRNPKADDGPGVSRPGCACVKRNGQGNQPVLTYNYTLWREGDLTMKQLVTVLLAAAFAAMSVSAIAQDKKAEKETTAKKAAPAKSTEKKAAPAKSTEKKASTKKSSDKKSTDSKSSMDKKSSMEKK